MNRLMDTNPFNAGQSIGAILVDSGKLTLADAERILRVQKEHGLRFGEAAIQLGLLSSQDIQIALAHPHQYDYPYLVKKEHGNEISDELIAAYQPGSVIRLRSCALCAASSCCAGLPASRSGVPWP